MKGWGVVSASSLTPLETEINPERACAVSGGPREVTVVRSGWPQTRGTNRDANGN